MMRGSFQLLDTTRVFVGVVAFGVLGIAASWALRWLERACCPWAPR